MPPTSRGVTTCTSSLASSGTISRSFFKLPLARRTFTTRRIPAPCACKIPAVAYKPSTSPFRLARGGRGAHWRPHHGSPPLHRRRRGFHGVLQERAAPGVAHRRLESRQARRGACARSALGGGARV